MYTVYIDDQVLYSPLLMDDGYSILSGKITQELNKAGSFEFVIPPNNVRYNDIEKLKSIVTLIADGQKSYSIIDGEKISESAQSSITSRVLYKTSFCDDTGKIVLSEPLNANGSDADEIWYNYKKYAYFYGDYADGSSDSKVYKYTSVSRSTSTSGSVTVKFYAYSYYEQISEESLVSKEIFRGRVLYSEKDFYNRRTVYCEGELAFLLDSIQRPYSFQGDVPELFSQFLSNHNSQVDSWKQFQVGNVTVTDPNNYINRESTQYPNTLDEMKEKLVKTHGGYLKPRLYDGVRYLDYVKNSGRNNSQVIEFGVNLLDITEYITAEDVFTVLIPLGAKQKDDSGQESRLTIESVNDGKDYIESNLGISLFGRIVKVQEWNDVTIAENLLTKGNAFLESGIEMSVSLQLKAIDLHLVDVDIESMFIGDDVRVVSSPHNIDTFFQCSKIELDIITADNSVYTFGTSFTALTDKNVTNTKEIYQIAVDSQKIASESARSLTQKEVFNIISNNGQIQGILLDEKTGDIYINASYIKSGTLTLGGDNPQMEVVNGEGIVCVKVDSTGIHILDGEVNATSGSLENMTITDGITISSKTNTDLKDIPLVRIEETENPSGGTSYLVTFGSITGKSTPLSIEGSSIVLHASSGITFKADNLIFENPVNVPDIYVDKNWTALELLNNFQNKGYEANQLEYRKIGNHVYIRGAVNFPDSSTWSGSSILVANLPSSIKPTKGNHYELNACGGARIARVIATTNGLSIEWIRKLSDGSNDTSTTGLWVSMNMDYFID